MSMKSGILSINKSPIWLENFILEESKANGHLSEKVKCPTKMDDRSTASDIKKRKKQTNKQKERRARDPFQGWAFLSMVVAAIASFCIKACPFLGLGNHVGKLAK